MFQIMIEFFFNGQLNTINHYINLLLITNE